jgi:PilZ domain
MDRESIDWSTRGARRPVRLTAQAHWPDGTAASVTVSNLSYEGCQLTSLHQFVHGETVALSLPGRGVIHAQIRWVRNRKAGVRFLTGDSRDTRRARIGV